MMNASGYTEPTRNDNVTIGTSVVIIAPIEKRKVIYIKNTSSSATAKINIFFSPQSAEVGKGVELSAGEYIVDSNTDLYECWQGTITAISNEAGATANIFIR